MTGHAYYSTSLTMVMYMSRKSLNTTPAFLNWAKIHSLIFCFGRIVNVHVPRRITLKKYSQYLKTIYNSNFQHINVNWEKFSVYMEFSNHIGSKIPENAGKSSNLCTIVEAIFIYTVHEEWCELLVEMVLLFQRLKKLTSNSEQRPSEMKKINKLSK